MVEEVAVLQLLLEGLHQARCLPLLQINDSLNALSSRKRFSKYTRLLDLVSVY